MKAKSIKGNSAEVIKTDLIQSLAEGYKPTLAFVFISIKQDLEAITKLLDQYNIQIFGATTGGEFIDGEIGAGTIAILLLDLDPSNFMVLLEDYSDKDPEILTQTMALKAKERFKNPSFILSIYAVAAATSTSATIIIIIKRISILIKRILCHFIVFF